MRVPKRARMVSCSNVAQTKCTNKEITHRATTQEKFQKQTKKLSWNDIPLGGDTKSSKINLFNSKLLY